LVKSLAMKAQNDQGPPELEMTFDINILEHLGLRMYTSLPAVVSEFVANCWDAGARSVKVAIPQDTKITPNYIVRIWDNGCGMTADEVNKKFLVVGRSKRVEDGRDTITVDGKERKVMGNKGIGKLAGFGVAGCVSILTVRAGHFVKFTMDYDAMHKVAKEAQGKEIKTVYRPSVEDWGETTDPDGTVVELSRLKRVQIPDVDVMRRHLARRFSVVGKQYSFNVCVNEKEIKPADRQLQSKCEIIWEFDEPINDGKSWVVKGWIGSFPKHATLTDEFERGIIIMARGKMVQMPMTFEFGGKGFSGMLGTAYLVGELHAEFLDEETDEIATHRSGIIWESEKGQALRNWGAIKVKKICAEWLDKRAAVKLKVIVDQPVYKERIAKLPSIEKKVIDGFLKKLAAKEETDAETVKYVAEFMATGAEYKGFLELVKVLEESAPEKPEILIKFLREWEILDAVEMARIIEGRIQAIIKFQQLVNSDAKEKPDVHNFLVDNPWLLDPTWNYIDDEVTYSELLKSEFPDEKEPPEEKRIDFLCLGYGRVLNIIEIKRPNITLNVKHLSQLYDYMRFIKAHIGNSPRSYDSAVGYLIGGKLGTNSDFITMKDDYWKLGMFTCTYEELQSTAIKAHKRFLDVIGRKANRIKDLRICESYERLSKAFKSQQPTD